MALKSKQKYGKKGTGKHISKKVWKLLECYFLEGDVDKSKRFTAATQHRQKIAEKSIEISSNNYPELDKQYST
ncbi:36576_t:CDS:2 [Gigaspora margarita]|uniref:36576_t:CDS:1 n=1 Tax=Gigaspora margarita TaxID=4874 RepID=A0ABN7UQZ6_GIGMA|nr:36576_t:CDS:2 [Gigaspora margarita]